MNTEVQNGKNLTAILSEMQQELQDFVQTRFTMLKIELREKARVLKAAAPSAVLGAPFLLTAFLLLTLAIAGLIYLFLPVNPYRWFLAFLCISILWAIIGSIAAYVAMRELQVQGLLPERTVEVLKEDKLWIQSEVSQRG